MYVTDQVLLALAEWNNTRTYTETERFDLPLLPSTPTTDFSLIIRVGVQNGIRRK